jgi:glycosyltransferase involved in cell wall biosynthesis
LLRSRRSKKTLMTSETSEVVGTPLRVVHLVPALFGATGVVGGAERYAFELARHMADRTDTRLVTFGDGSVERREGNLDIHVIGGSWHVRGERHNPVSPSVVPHLLWADVVHCHQTHVLMSSTAAVVSRMTGRRVFATELGGGGWDLSAFVSTDTWFNGHLHISEYSRSIYGHASKPWARVILGGVDAARFSPDPAVQRAEAPLYVGRLLPHKGVADLIAALPCGMAADIIGPRNGGHLPDLEARAAGKPVRFHHDVGDEALTHAYRRALCLVLPSVYRTPDGEETKVPELLGQTLLEAMACGTPVICTRAGSMPEVVTDGETGFIVEPGDRAALRHKLEWLAAHKSEADAMGMAGRQTVLARFQWPQVVERCLDAYRS